MIVEDLYYNTIYPLMKKYVETNSIYHPIVTKKYTNQSKKFPIVPTKLLPVVNHFNNLSYGEQTYDFGIDINVYSIDKTVDDKKYKFIFNIDNALDKQLYLNLNLPEYNINKKIPFIKK